jgi:plasmid stabilization system protein ParE
MDYQIEWSQPAINDLRSLVQYIARDDGTTAERFGNRIIAKIESIAAFPHIGRVVPEFHQEPLREVILPPYRLIYEVDDQNHRIYVLRIWHGARGNPAMDAK